MTKYVKILDFSHADFLNVQLKLRSWLSAPEAAASKSMILEMWKKKGYQPNRYYCTVCQQVDGKFYVSLRCEMFQNAENYEHL